MYNAHRTADATKAFDIAALLFRLSGMLTHARFKACLNSNHSRFAWTTDATFESLRAKLRFQGAMLRGLSARAPLDECMLALAEQCEAQANRLVGQYDLKISKGDRDFSIPAGSNAELVIIAMLERTTELSSSNSDLEFYLVNTLHSLRTYAQAIQTLRYPTPNASFERLLAGVDEQWLLKGYPHDLLSHDASDVRSGNHSPVMFIRESYCSTLMDETQIIAPNYIRIDLRQQQAA